MADSYNRFECNYSADLISYLYDEIEAARKSDFETHLRFCAQCADEISSFGDVRASVLEMRGEFALLETPVFKLPFEKTENQAVDLIAARRENSFYDNLRRIFSFSPAWSFAVFAFLAAGLFLGAAIYKFSAANEIAENNNFNRSDSAVLTANDSQNKSVATKNDSSNATVVSDNAKISQNQKSVETVSSVDSNEKTNAGQNQSGAVKISAVSAKQTEKIKNSRTPKQTGTNESGGNVQNNKKGGKASTQRVPKLIDEEETKDESLRLADLFAEIDAR